MTENELYSSIVEELLRMIANWELVHSDLDNDLAYQCIEFHPDFGSEEDQLADAIKVLREDTIGTWPYSNHSIEEDI